MDSKIIALFCLLSCLGLSPVEGFVSSGVRRDTYFYLFTPGASSTNVEKIASGNPGNIRSTSFDPNLRLTVIVHGFRQNGFVQWISKMRKELMKKEKMNIIVVDWKASTIYSQAAGNTRTVGHQLANLIKELHSHFRYNSSKVHVIGHSLGAHVAGFAGASFLNFMRGHLKIGRITGLDPARPRFDRSDPRVRLDPSDAEFVDVIHTDVGYNYLKGGLGLERKSGHVDFYPNGGASQPGCSDIGDISDADRKLLALAQGNLDPRIFACDHMKVINYFTSSINNHCSRKAFPCGSWEAFKRGRCFRCEGACPEMGYNADQYHVSGSHKFYLSTYKDTGCAPRHYVSVFLSGLKVKKSTLSGFWFLGSLIDIATTSTKKIGISLTTQNGKIIQTAPSELEDASQISRLVLSDDRPGPLTSIILSYSGSQEIYVRKVTLRDDNNNIYTACFNRWISSSGTWGSNTSYSRAKLRRGDHGC